MTRETVMAGLVVLAVYATLAHCVGCEPHHQGMALDVAGHSLALTQCRAEGKDAGSYAVYERCADDVDRRFMDGGAR